MSYLHCPSCQRAYNVAAQLACPHCGVRAGAPADPTADVVAAAEQLARAMARATATELAAAGAALEQRVALRALPAPGQTAIAATTTSDRARQMLANVRYAVVPQSRPAMSAPPAREPVITGRPRHAMLTTVAIAVLTRIAPRPARLAALALAPTSTSTSTSAAVPPRREGLASGLRRAARALLAFA